MTWNGSNIKIRYSPRTAPRREIQAGECPCGGSTHDQLTSQLRKCLQAGVPIGGKVFRCVQQQLDSRFQRRVAGSRVHAACPLPESAGPMVAASSSEPVSVPIKRNHSGNHTSRTNGKSRIFLEPFYAYPRSPPPAPPAIRIAAALSLADPVPGTSC